MAHKKAGGSTALGRDSHGQRLGVKLYGERRISERHRHRYEYNNAYRQKLEKSGLRVSGTTPDGQLVEIVERPDHPFFIGVQFHPEFQSRPTRPHPLFLGFVRAALKNSTRRS